MKNIFISTLVVISLIACGNSNDKKNQSDNTQEAAKATIVEEYQLVKTLDYKSFIKNVWDFEKYPDSLAYRGDLPCIIDFYADWCGPCKKVAPIMEELAKDYEGKIIVYKVNTDNERKLATIFKIRSIPTVFFIPKSGQAHSQVGALNKEEYKNIIDKYLINNN